MKRLTNAIDTASSPPLPAEILGAIGPQASDWSKLRAALEAADGLGITAAARTLGLLRLQVEYLSLVLQEHARLSRDLAAGEGAAQEHEKLQLAVLLLKASRPADAKDAEKMAGEMLDLQRREHQSLIRAQLAGDARAYLDGIEASTPEFFDGGRPGKGGAGYPTLGNFLRQRMNVEDWRLFGKVAEPKKRRRLIVPGAKGGAQ